MTKKTEEHLLPNWSTCGCFALRVSRSSLRYRSVSTDNSALRSRLRGITETRVPYCYRRVHVMLRREGWRDKLKRIYRLYSEQGLYPNQARGMDFFLMPYLTGIGYASWQSLISTHANLLGSAWARICAQRRSQRWTPLPSHVSYHSCWKLITALNLLENDGQVGEWRGGPYRLFPAGNT